MTDTSPSQLSNTVISRYNNVNKARRYPPADGSSINKIAADLRPSADWSSVHTLPNQHRLRGAVPGVVCPVCFAFVWPIACKYDVICRTGNT